jgi:predicted metal-dependent phosphoesterase TrpH
MDKKNEGNIMGYADLHIHTIYSEDATNSIPAILKYVSEKTQLNVIAITDHDAVGGVREAMKLAPSYGLEVIPGIEISTADGHLIALFVNEVVPAGLSLIETLERVNDLGGICIVPHPEARGVPALTQTKIEEALTHPHLANVLVGIEACNGGLVYTRSSIRTQQIADALPLAHVGSSDAHILRMIGKAQTWFPGNSAKDLYQALIKQRTIAIKESGLDGKKIVSQWLPAYILRKLGWVKWNKSPADPMVLTRLKKVMVTH